MRSFCPACPTPDLLQSRGRHASDAFKQGELGQVLEEPLVARQQLGICGVLLHQLVTLLPVFEATFAQHQRQTLKKEMKQQTIV